MRNQKNSQSAATLQTIKEPATRSGNRPRPMSAKVMTIESRKVYADNAPTLATQDRQRSKIRDAHEKLLKEEDKKQTVDRLVQLTFEEFQALYVEEVSLNRFDQRDPCLEI